jgi:phosphoribosyl-ATP pyrophosphohydrolase/phosphoribosyl-AMP cyclohydrolase
MKDVYEIDFDKGEGLIPAVVQDASSKSILMLGYMNKEAFDITLETRHVCFYSRSKERLWVKGETSGNFLEVQSFALDCDNDALLFQAKPQGPTCHLGRESCFASGSGHLLHDLEKTIGSRIRSADTQSYTRSLIQSGIGKVAQKIGEEGVELSLAVMAGDRKAIVHEAADLMFHTLVGLASRDISLNEVLDELKDRQREQKASG